MLALSVISLALLVALILTPLIRQLGLSLNWVDHPGERKLHQKPMVRIGGVAIALSTLITLLILWRTGEFYGLSSQDTTIILGILLGSVSFFAIGLLDDVLNLHPLLRLLLQAIAVGMSWQMGVRVEAVPVPGIGAVPLGILSLPITFLWLAGVANAMNWMDGMDGLAAGIATIAALMFSALGLEFNHPAIALLSFSLVGALLGFLRYNKSPATIFMGDSGSYFIGFFLAAIGITSTVSDTSFNTVVLPYVVLSIPILDMVLVIISRLLSGKSPLFPDQRHLHHRLLQAGFTRQNTVWLIFGLMVWAGLNAIALSYSPLGWIGTAGLIVVLGCTNLTLWQQLIRVFSRSQKYRNVA